MKNKVLFSFFICLFCSSTLQATHNRAGEISVKQIGPMTYRVTIHTYTKTSSRPADRDSLRMDWGDGNISYIQRTSETELPNDIKYNQYTTEHVYAEERNYLLQVTDPNRNGGILNVNPPSSDNIPFHIETDFNAVNMASSSGNSSPLFLQAPIDKAILGQRFVHNPNGYDVDGDSLSYELIVPLQSNGDQVPNYSFPNEISPGASNTISINPVSGEFVWDTPQRSGEYNIAIRVNEYRNGSLIGYMIRDMQIEVLDGLGGNPVEVRFSSPPPTNIPASELISFDYIAESPGALIKLSASGGPFIVDQPATFTAPNDFSSSPVTGQFSWNTDDIHISDRPWQVVLKAENEHQFFSMETIRFTVSATTGFSSPESLLKFKSYPNPTQEGVTVEWQIKDNNSGNLSLQLYAISGKLIKEIRLEGKAGVQSIDLSHFPKGTYQLSLMQGIQLVGTQTIIHQ